MINRLVLAYGPPKCGKHAAGKVLLGKHQWGHVSLRRSLLKVDEVYLGLGVADMLKASDTADDDIAIPAFMLRIAECARLEAGKNVFFEGVFGRPTQVIRVIDHAARFARHVEVVEFQLPDSEVWKRIGKSGDDRYKNLEFGRTIVAEYRRNQPTINKLAAARVVRLGEKGSHYSIDASEPVQTIVSRIIKRGKKAA